MTDNPATPAPNDPTTFTLAAAPVVTGTKTATGNPAAGQNITYTVTLTNSGCAAQGDNPGNEFTDTLPATLTLVSANSSSGTITTAGNTVNWNGAIPAGGTVTITIVATIVNGTPTGTTINNQGTISYDANGDGTNDTTTVTDNPATPAGGDPTPIVVAGGAILDVPTRSDFGLAALCLALTGAALMLMRRRRTAA